MNPLARSIAPALFVAVLLAPAAAHATDDGARDNANPDSAEEPSKLHGVSFGDFYYRDVRPVEAVKLRISFVLFIAVAEDQLPRMEREFERRQHRLRSAVLTAIRLCRVREFHEPELLTLRRRVEAQLRRVDPNLPKMELLISEFAFIAD